MSTRGMRVSTLAALARKHFSERWNRADNNAVWSANRDVLSATCKWCGKTALYHDMTRQADGGINGACSKHRELLKMPRHA